MRNAISLVVLLALIGGVRAEDFSSTNTLKLTRFWNAVEKRSGPVTVMAFGDSVQPAWRSVATWLFPRLAASLGSAGIALPEQVNNLSLGELGGPYQTIYPDNEWWDVHVGLPPGSYYSWTNQNSLTGSIESDHAGIYYMARPDGGVFTLNVSSNGGPWIARLTVNASNVMAAGRFSKVDLPRGFYRVRADTISGTNVILGPDLGLSNSNGLKTVFIERNGLNLGIFLAVSPVAEGPIFAQINPDLVIWHMKELWDSDQDPITLSNRLELLEVFWREYTPNADILYIGTPYAYSQTSTTTVDQNRIVRALAVRHGRAYVDGMTAMIDFNTMANGMYLNDYLHPNNKYYQWLANTLWDQTLFSALRKDRSVQIQPFRDGFCITGPRLTNTVQRLLSSTNLVDWTTVGTVEVSSPSCAFTNPPGTFFRWQFFPAN